MEEVEGYILSIMQHRRKGRRKKVFSPALRNARFS